VIVTTIVLFVIIGGLAGIKFWQISTLMAVGEQMQKAGPPPETVASDVAEARSWKNTLGAVGTVAGLESVAIANELPGVVTRLRFDSGAVVKRGQPLVELDTSVERAQLASAKARRDLARMTAERGRGLVAARAMPQAELDSAETQLATAESDIAQLQAQIDHKVVRAPFAGRAGIRAVNVGQYLAAGTTVTTVDSVGAVWVDFSLPQEVLSQLRVGNPVEVTVRGQPAQDGTISAIDQSLDAATRNIKLRATLPDKAGTLRSGMFVTVTVVLPATTNVVVVPATAIVHAPYGDSVFVVDGKVARQQFVRLGGARGDFVAVREGLQAGQTIVSIGAFKLRNGSPIAIDNRIKPKPELQPHPENR
jgi:membrane fusion protein (multidrug efflux system)